MSLRLIAVVFSVFATWTVLFCQQSAAANQRGELTKEQLSLLIPSSSRFVASLSGDWQFSLNQEDWETRKTPYSDSKKTRHWLKKTFRIERNIIHNYVWNVWFLGLSNEVEIYLNNQFIGRQFGGLAPLSVRLPDKALVVGANTIELLIIPPTQFNQRHIFSEELYTGVVRDVLLVGTPVIWTNDVRVSNALIGQNTWNLSARLNISSGNVTRSSIIVRTDSAGIPINTSAARVEAALTMPDQGSVAVGTASKDVKIESDRLQEVLLPLTISNPRLWSPALPYLYELKIRIYIGSQLIDDYTVPVGFRDIRTGGSSKMPSVVLNGQALALKGVEYVENWGEIQGKTGTLGQYEKDIRLIKTLGANLVRVRSAPPHPYFVELCNRNGLLLMIDLPAYDVPNSFLMTDEVFVRMKNIAERLAIDYERSPSVIAWGIGDGLDEQGSGLAEYQRKITETFRKYSSKMLYKTIRFGSRSCDSKGLDFLCLRTDPRWSPGDILIRELNRLVELSPGKPTLLTFGKLIQPENKFGYSDPHSVESQAQYIRDVYRSVEQAKLAGMTVFTLNDYRTGSPILTTNSTDKYLVTSGLVDESRTQRLSFQMLKALFNDEREPPLRAGLYKEDTPLIFIVVGIVVAIFILLMMSRFRRFREYVLRALLRPYNFYADIRDQRILSNVQTVVLGLGIAVTAASIASSTLFYHRTSLGAEFLLMLVQPNALKYLINEIAWSPEIAIVALSSLMYLLFLVLAALVRLFAAFVQGRFYFSDALTIATWSMLPLILLLPISMVTYKVFTITDSTSLMTSVAALMFLWCGFRILRATAVVFDIRSLWVYTVGIALTSAVLGGGLFLYNYQTAFLSYIEYYLSVMN